MLKIGTDFSGVGSPETALKRLGIEHQVLFACDIDKYARTSYEALHKPQQMFEDITTRPTDFSQLDLYVAGFPCQSFSIAGKRKGFECPTNGTLFHTLSEFIRINQPKCFILENVKGLVNHDNGRTFQIIKDKLSGSGGSVNDQMFLTDIDGLGYHIHYKVLNTKDFGLPQNRERIFIVGFKDARQFSFPVGEPLTIRLKDILQYEVNKKYYLSDKIIKGFQNHKERHTEKGTGFQWSPKNGEDIANCLRANASLCPTDNSIIVHSTQAVEWVADYRNDEGLRKRKDKIVPCLTKRRHSESDISSMPPIIKQNKIRRLTPLECFRLQGFTDEEHNICQKVQSDTQLYKQMGNTISVPVIQAILKNIYNA